jgi:hypothetical protein
LTAQPIKRADGSALAVGSIKSGMYLDLVYNAGSSEWRCANISPLQPVASVLTTTPGLILLTSGTVSGAGALDLVLTSYTAYRAIKVVLNGFRPATDAVQLLMRFSTDGGSTYDAGAGNYGASATTGSLYSAGTAAAIFLTSAVGNASSEGVAVEVTIHNQTSTAFFTQSTWLGSYMDSSGTSTNIAIFGSGARLAAQDTDAVRFLFSSGNITSGNYAVYGLI